MKDRQPGPPEGKPHSQPPPEGKTTARPAGPTGGPNGRQRGPVERVLPDREARSVVLRRAPGDGARHLAPDLPAVPQGNSPWNFRAGEPVAAPIGQHVGRHRSDVGEPATE